MRLNELITEALITEAKKKRKKRKSRSKTPSTHSGFRSAVVGGWWSGWVPAPGDNSDSEGGGDGGGGGE